MFRKVPSAKKPVGLLSRVIRLRSKARVDLPLDVLWDIIDQLAIPTNPLSYLYDKDVLRTLCSLCLVSRAIRHRAIFHIFERISINLNRPGTLQILQRRLPGPPIRSLYLKTGGGTRKELEDIVRLLRFVAPTLHRLMIDSDMYPWDYPKDVRHDIVGQAVADLPVLRELVFVRRLRKYLYSLWSETAPARVWNHLRHIVLEGVPLDHDLVHFLQRCPNARTLAIPFTIPSEQAESLIHLIVGTLPSLQRLILITPDDSARCSDSSVNLPGLCMSAQEKRAIARRARITINEVHAKMSYSSDLASWIAQQSRFGALWTLRGTIW